MTDLRDRLIEAVGPLNEGPSPDGALADALLPTVTDEIRVSMHAAYAAGLDIAETICREVERAQSLLRDVLVDYVPTFTGDDETTDCECTELQRATVCHDMRNEPHLVGCPRWGTRDKGCGECTPDGDGPCLYGCQVGGTR